MGWHHDLSTLEIWYSPRPTAKVNVKSPGLISHDVNWYQKSITVFLKESNLFVRHHCTLKSFTYGENEQKFNWVNQASDFFNWSFWLMFKRKLSVQRNFHRLCRQDGWFLTILLLPFSHFWIISGYVGVFLSIFPHLLSHYVHWRFNLVYDDAAIMYILKMFMGTIIVKNLQLVWPRCKRMETDFEIIFF